MVNKIYCAYLKIHEYCECSGQLRNKLMDIKINWYKFVILIITLLEIFINFINF